MSQKVELPPLSDYARMKMERDERYEPAYMEQAQHLRVALAQIATLTAQVEELQSISLSVAKVRLRAEIERSEKAEAELSALKKEEAFLKESLEMRGNAYKALNEKEFERANAAARVHEQRKEIVRLADENQRMRELLTRAYGHLSCDCEVAKEVESFLAEHP